MSEEKVKWYVSSSNELLDIRTINTERLINSLAKHNRDIYLESEKDKYVFHREQINLINEELLRRNEEYRKSMIGDGK